MARVTAPVKGFTGKVVGAMFDGGIATVEDERQLAYFRRHGYTVEEADDTAKVPDGDPAKSWNNAQITAWAEANEVDLSGASTKAEMLAAIAASKTPAVPLVGEQGTEPLVTPADGNVTPPA